MFFRLKTSGQRGYVQIVENKRDGAAVRQRVIANLGRADELATSGALASLMHLATKLTDQVLLITALDEEADGALSVACRADRRADAVRPDLGAARGSARSSTISWPGSRVRVPGRARRVRRRAAPPHRLGIGSRLLGMDGGLRHPRGRVARPASLLPGTGSVEEVEEERALHA